MRQCYPKKEHKDLVAEMEGHQVDQERDSRQTEQDPNDARNKGQDSGFQHKEPAGKFLLSPNRAHGPYLHPVRFEHGHHDRVDCQDKNDSTDHAQANVKNNLHEIDIQSDGTGRPAPVPHVDGKACYGQFPAQGGGNPALVRTCLCSNQDEMPRIVMSPGATRPTPRLPGGLPPLSGGAPLTLTGGEDSLAPLPRVGVPAPSVNRESMFAFVFSVPPWFCWPPKRPVPRGRLVRLRIAAKGTENAPICNDHPAESGITWLISNDPGKRGFADCKRMVVKEG